MRQEIRERIEQIRWGEVPEGYKRTKVGVIPEDWEVKHLDEIAIINPKKEILDDNAYVSFVGMSDISEDARLVCSHPRLYKEVSSGYTSFREKDVLVAKITPCFENGKGAIVENLINGVGFGSTEFHVIRPRFVGDEYFIFSHTLTERFRKTGEKSMTGSAGQKRIPKDFLQKYKIPYPKSRLERLSIASICKNLSNRIELKKKLIEQKKLQKKGLMQLLLTGKVRWNDANKHSKQELDRRLSLIQCGEVPDGYKKTRFGIVPKDWEVRKAKQLFENYVDKNHGGMLEVLSVTQDRGAIPRSQLEIDIKYDESSVTNYKKVNRGDFIISLRSFQGGIEYSRYEGIISPAYTVIRNIVNIDKDYYRYLFKSKLFVSRLSAAVYGIRDGKQIGFNDFGEMYLPYPPIEEQQKIAQILSTLDKSIHLLEQELEALKQQKKGLMQLLLTGIIRVHELEKVEC